MHIAQIDAAVQMNPIMRGLMILSSSEDTTWIAKKLLFSLVRNPDHEPALVAAPVVDDEIAALWTGALEELGIDHGALLHHGDAANLTDHSRW